jgi:hypothetical protein
MEKFKEMTTCKIGTGKTICIWTDKWGEEENAESAYSHLHSFAKDPNISVDKVLTEANIYNLFHLPLSHIAHQELQELSSELADATTCNLVESWNFQWSNPIYSTKKFYRGTLYTSCHIGYLEIMQLTTPKIICLAPYESQIEHQKPDDMKALLCGI